MSNSSKVTNLMVQPAATIFHFVLSNFGPLPPLLKSFLQLSTTTSIYFISLQTRPDRTLYSLPPSGSARLRADKNVAHGLECGHITPWITRSSRHCQRGSDHPLRCPSPVPQSVPAAVQPTMSQGYPAGSRCWTRPCQILLITFWAAVVVVAGMDTVSEELVWSMWRVP